MTDDPEVRGDARPPMPGSHVGLEWDMVQGKYGPITLWRTVDGHSTHLTLSRASALALMHEVAGFLGFDVRETELRTVHPQPEKIS
jgi:hypothetical protein